MTRFLFSILCFLFTAAAMAQSHNADKNSVSRIESNVIEINAVAIPYDQVSTVVIDSSTYHKAVNAGNGRTPVSVEVTAVAIRAENAVNTVKKEAVEISRSVHQAAIEGAQKNVEVTVPAARR